MNAESEREDKAPRLTICLKKAIKLLLIYSSNTFFFAQSLAQSRFVEYAHVLPTNTDTDTATCAANASARLARLAPRAWQATTRKAQRSCVLPGSIC